MKLRVGFDLAEICTKVYRAVLRSDVCQLRAVTENSECEYAHGFGSDVCVLIRASAIVFLLLSNINWKLLLLKEESVPRVALHSLQSPSGEIHMWKKVVGVTTAALLGFGSVSLAASGALAHESPEQTRVLAGAIDRVETSDNYTAWHQGVSDWTGAIATSPNGLVVSGKTQLIKGEESLPQEDIADALKAYATSSVVELASGNQRLVTHQIGFGYSSVGDSGEQVWTTLRQAVGATDTALWTTSKALGTIPAGGTDTLDNLLAAVPAEASLDYLSGGFLFFPGASNETVTVRSYTVAGKQTSFVPEAFTGSDVETVHATQIPNTETDAYYQWHNGNPKGGKYSASSEGLSIDNGPVRIVKGLEDGSHDAASFITGLSIDAPGVQPGNVFYQVSVFFGPGAHESDTGVGYTTLRKDVTTGIEGDWVSSSELPAVGARPAIQKNKPAHLDDIFLALGEHRVTAYGFYAERAATIASFTGNGMTTTFAKKSPNAGGPIVVTPPAATGESVALAPGDSYAAVVPAGVFAAGEKIGVYVMRVEASEAPSGSGETPPAFAAHAVLAAKIFAADSDVESQLIKIAEVEASGDGSVEASVTIPDTLPKGSYRVVFKSGDAHFWAESAIAVEQQPGTETGGGNGVGGNGTNAGGKSAVAGERIANTGSATASYGPLALGTAALVAGLVLLLSRRKLTK